MTVTRDVVLKAVPKRLTRSPTHTVLVFLTTPSFSSLPHWQCVANVRRSHPGLLVGGMFYFRVRRVVFGQAGNRPLLYLL